MGGSWFWIDNADALRPRAPLFARHGWPPAWRNGIYDFHHYHPNAHEALAIAVGHVRVRLGAEAGVTLDLVAGDVVVLPAGTAHRNLGQSPDLLWPAAAAVCLAAGAAALALERSIPAGARTTPKRTKPAIAEA